MAADTIDALELLDLAENAVSAGKWDVATSLVNKAVGALHDEELDLSARELGGVAVCMRHAREPWDIAEALRPVSARVRAARAERDAAAAAEAKLFGELELVALKHLQVETLRARNRDSLDFVEVSVVALGVALRAAYEAGRRAR